MSSLVPNDWDLLPLQNVFTLTSGKAKTMKNLTSKSQENPVPVFGGNGINGYCSDAMLTESTVVIGRVGEYCGVVHLSPEISWMTDNALYIKKLNLGFDKSFIFYLLTHASLDKLRSKSGQPLISQKPIYELSLAFPPLPEQQKIAKILTSVDQVIEKTQAQIDKLKDLKTGMMQELLTNGIGHTEFKDSPVGRIPAEWDITTMGDCFERLSAGMTPSRTRPDYFDGSILWITSGELNRGYLVDSREKITKDAVQDTRLRIYPKGTFLIAIIGLEAKGTRGKCAVLGKEAAVNQQCVAFEPNEHINTHYLFQYYLLHSDSFANEYTQGTKQQSYNAGIIKLLPLVLPPLKEQQEIASILSSIDIRIESAVVEVHKFKSLKKALMQDLLTGKVRVKTNKTNKELAVV